LASPLIQQQIARALVGKPGAGVLRDHGQHQIHLRHRRSSRGDLDIADHQGIGIELHGRIHSTEDRGQPPGRGGAPSIEQACRGQQEDARAGGRNLSAARCGG
jgi:hypothetical protein